LICNHQLAVRFCHGAPQDTVVEPPSRHYQGTIKAPSSHDAAIIDPPSKPSA
jgi:hypothetical protein